MNALYDRSHLSESWPAYLHRVLMLLLIYVAFPIAFWFGLIALTVWIWRML